LQDFFSSKEKKPSSLLVESFSLTREKVGKEVRECSALARFLAAKLRTLANLLQEKALKKQSPIAHRLPNLSS
jgi:hypothetical protein